MSSVHDLANQKKMRSKKKKPQKQEKKRRKFFSIFANILIDAYGHCPSIKMIFTIIFIRHFDEFLSRICEKS